MSEKSRDCNACDQWNTVDDMVQFDKRDKWYCYESRKKVELISNDERLHAFKRLHPNFFPGVAGVGARISGPGTGAPHAKSPGFLGYNEICEASWSQKQFDSAQGAAYASDNSEWVSYDRVQNIKQKCDLISKYMCICGLKFNLLRSLKECVNGYKPFFCISDGFNRDPHDCNKYYRCYQGIKYFFSCPTELYFDEKILGCEWPYNVKC
uniref:Chitin-binding type-2 domain-containing protein n=1 Tax=Anopheles funestus TaxID=62324 RepID=A0A182R2K2_ANOFN